MALKQNSIFEKVSGRKPDPQVITAAANVLKAGGLLAFPTTGLYGLGADALDPRAVERVFRIKQRDLDKPILVLIENESELRRIATHVPQSASRLMAAFWPGALTVILEARQTLPFALTGGTGKIGIRVPKHPVALALVSAFDGPITGTSANLSGKEGCASVADLSPGLVQKLDMVMDGGLLKGGVGSTVVDATMDPPVVVREGAISKERLFEVL
jgi:L-threonylcarbamoyladenylate synthase